MRLVLVLLVVVVACKADTRGRRDAALDAFVYHDAGIDSPMCGASGSCANGPACGSGCCGSGEYCVNSTCMCGTGSGCTDGNWCQSGGPVAPVAPAYCGYLCCGGTQGCPVVK